jgi:hypothetical protein
MKQEIITFRNMDDYSLGNLKQQEPSCFNSIIRVIKYKITIEEIQEPKELICERLEKLYVECDDWRNREALDSVAKKYKYNFKEAFGSKRG